MVVLVTRGKETLKKKGLKDGNEDKFVCRYEKKHMQEKVIEMYKLLKEDYWMEINADQPQETLLNILYENSLKTIQEIVGKPLEHLW